MWISYTEERTRPDSVLNPEGFGPILVQLIGTIQCFHGPESRYWTIGSVQSCLKNASAIARGRSSISYPTHLHPPRHTAMCDVRSCVARPMARRRPEWEFESADGDAARTVPLGCLGRRSPRSRGASSGSVFTVDSLVSGQPRHDSSVLL